MNSNVIETLSYYLWKIQRQCPIGEWNHVAGRKFSHTFVLFPIPDLRVSQSPYWKQYPITPILHATTHEQP